jgi:hypothetical protein
MMPNTPATLADHRGTLMRQQEGPLLWEGDLAADALAALLRRAMLEGTLLCRTADDELPVRLLGCHVDALSGRVVAELEAVEGAPS